MAELLPISSPLSAERQLDVVFVHGLGGDPITTWRSGTDENTSWPHWLAYEFGPGIGVWSLGYAAAPTKRRGLPFFGGKDPDAGLAMSLPRRAENALDRLVSSGIGQRPVFFITHSLGGLLVKSILRRSADSQSAPERLQVVQQCRGVLFLATPQHGSRLADLADAIRVYLPSVSTLDLKDNDDHLMDLYEWYRGYAPSHQILTRSYYENKQTKGVVVVVPRSSADPGVTGDTARGPTPLDRDHLEISKPRDRQDQAYLCSTQLIRLILSCGTPAAGAERSSATSASGSVASPSPSLPPPTPPTSTKPLVYVSYAWRSHNSEDLADIARAGLVDREQIVDELCMVLAEEDEIVVGRDKKLVRTGDSIEDFASEIAKSGLILAVISKKSLRSKWCMKDELLQAFRRRNYDLNEFGTDVLPLILDDAEADFDDESSLIDYWSERLEKDRKKLERTDPERKFSPKTWRDVDDLEELFGRLLDLMRVLKIRKMPRGAEAIREKGFQEIRQLVLKRLQEKSFIPFSSKLAALQSDQSGNRALIKDPSLMAADVVALILAPSGEDKGGLPCYRWKAFVQKTGESEYKEIPSGTIGAEATSTKDKLPELLQRLKTWIDSGLADVAILEIFASDDLLDEDWGSMSIRAGEDRSLHDYQPYLLRSLSRLINPEWNGRRGGPLKRMHDHLAQGTGAWLPHADLTNEKKLRMLDGDVYDPQRGEDVVSAICCPQTRVLNNRSNWLKSVLESMAPLVVCPSRQSPLAEEQVTACLRQLALNRVDGKVERPYCPDLAQLAKARNKWSDPTIDLRGLTILVDHPDRRPDPEDLQDFTQSSRPPEGGQPQPLAAPLISP